MAIHSSVPVSSLTKGNSGMKRFVFTWKKGEETSSVPGQLWKPHRSVPRQTPSVARPIWSSVLAHCSPGTGSWDQGLNLSLLSESCGLCMALYTKWEWHKTKEVGRVRNHYLKVNKHNSQNGTIARGSGFEVGNLETNLWHWASHPLSLLQKTFVSELPKVVNTNSTLKKDILFINFHSIPPPGCSGGRAVHMTLSSPIYFHNQSMR